MTTTLSGIDTVDWTAYSCWDGKNYEGPVRAAGALLDSPFRVGFGTTMIAQDTSFIRQLTTLVSFSQ